MSIARAIRNRPKVWRVFFYRNRTDISPPTNPARRGMYFCFYYGTILLQKHKIARKMHTNEPTKSPNFMASLPKRTLKRCEGLLIILLIPKMIESPALMRQLNAAILELSLRMALTQLPECLQKGLFPSFPQFYIKLMHYNERFIIRDYILSYK